MSKVTLSISMDETGRIQCAGPFADKMLCYGLLGHLQEAIQKFQPPMIEPASTGEIVAVNGSRLRVEK